MPIIIVGEKYGNGIIISFLLYFPFCPGNAALSLECVNQAFYWVRCEASRTPVHRILVFTGGQGGCFRSQLLKWLKLFYHKLAFA